MCMYKNKSLRLAFTQTHNGKHLFQKALPKMVIQASLSFSFVELLDETTRACTGRSLCYFAQHALTLPNVACLQGLKTTNYLKQNKNQATSVHLNREKLKSAKHFKGFSVGGRNK